MDVRIELLQRQIIFPKDNLAFFAGISNEYGYDRIFDWLEYSKTELPLMCGILKELPEPESPKKTVYVMHMPPAGLHLGQLLYQDLDIGSVDIYEFLKAKQPLLSLHGHIHESPDTEKRIMDESDRYYNLYSARADRVWR